jgi:hypothetical protein
MSSLKENLILVFFILILLGFGLCLLFGISLPGVTGSGSHKVEGAERLLGIIPTILGVLLIIGLIPSKKQK